MKNNLGATDKMVRIILGLGLAVLFYIGILSDTWSIIAIILAIVLLVTGLSGTCALYSLLGFSSCKRGK